MGKLGAVTEGWANSEGGLTPKGMFGMSVAAGTTTGTVNNLLNQHLMTRGHNAYRTHKQNRLRTKIGGAFN